MFLYYITDRKQFSTDRAESIHFLLARIRAAAEAGVDAIQLRENDLSPRELIELGREARRVLLEANSADTAKPRTRLLINSRTDVAIACSADGVHLRADDILASEARAIIVQVGVAHPLVAVSCHSLEEVALAEAHGADFAVLGPVFGKSGADSKPAGVAELERVCKRPQPGNPKMPVLALGSVDESNAAECLQAGADGVGAIRLFQQGDVCETISRLRTIGARPK